MKPCVLNKYVAMEFFVLFWVGAWNRIILIFCYLWTQKSEQFRLNWNGWQVCIIQWLTDYMIKKSLNLIIGTQAFSGKGFCLQLALGSTPPLNLSTSCFSDNPV